MDTLRANIINETEKLFLKRKTKVFLFIIALICFMSAFFMSKIQASLGFLALSSISFPLISLSIITNVFLPLFIFMVAAEVFSSEMGNRTLKVVLTKPISRLKVFISKNVAIVIYIIINLAVVLLVSILAESFLNSKLMWQSMPNILWAYVIDIVPQMVLSLFAVLIAQFFKNSSGTIVTCLLAFIALQILGFIFRGFSNVIFTSYLNWYSYLPIGTGNIIREVTVFFMVIAYGVIFFTAGYYIFDNKDV